MHGTMPPVPKRRSPRVPLVLRLALREMRAGLSGFGVFLACIVLGVMAIAGVSSISRSLTEGLAREGRTILGGDMAFTLIHREATPDERAFLDGLGRLSMIAASRGMAHAGDKGSALVDMKAVDGLYPVIGTLVTDPPLPRETLFAQRDGRWGGVVDPVLLARLDLKPGDVVRVGEAEIELRAAIVSEPDKIANGIGFGPRLIVSLEALRATGLLMPGSLVRWTYRIDLPEQARGETDLVRVAAEAERLFPQAGWEVRSRVNADPRFSRNIERFSQFLTLVGLTALLVGGVGVANAVRGFVDRKRNSIAVLKSLGAPGGQVVGIYLVQVLMIAGLGIAGGLIAGAALPYLLTAAVGHLLPIPITPTLAWSELATAALYGVLTALAFALSPLGRADDIQVSGLFRDQIDPDRRWPRPRYVVALVIAVAALLGVSVFAAYDRRIALLFIAIAAGAFLILRGVALAVMAAARRLPRPRRTAPRLALANLHRPGALTPSLVLSLGLGITLLATLAIVDANLRRQLTQSLPEQAPTFFFLDVPSRDAEGFAAFMERQAPGAKVERVPMMRGRIVSVKGVPAEQVRAAQDVAWVLDGDRGITFAATPPEGSVIVEGSWWAADHTGPALVSFDERIAAGLGLSVGDEVTVNVLGRNLTARIASLRRIEWRSIGINFVMVFSPNTFAGAPHTQLATAALPGGPDPRREAAILRDLGRDFPMVTSIRVKDALDAVNDVVGQLVAAIRGASSIALLASVLVLAGALAAGQRARLYDAVVLKTLGATRPRLVLAYALEYGALGVVGALFGLLVGGFAAYLIVSQVMKFPFEPLFGGAFVAAAAAIVVTIGLGLAATWRILSQKPAPHLRNL